MMYENKQKYLTLKDLRNLQDRLDSQSKRIRKIHTKLANIIENHRYYVSKRLPKVIERENSRIGFTKEFNRAKTILRAFGKENFVMTSTSKNADMRKDRYIGMFTHVEMQRLRRLLAKDLRTFKTE